MKTPGYWKNKGFYARLLLPVGMLYSAATAFRFKLKQPRKVPVPVICIGNLTAGGTGKTPTAAEIANLLKKGGYKPAFVSRGYGGSLCGVTSTRKAYGRGSRRRAAAAGKGSAGQHQPRSFLGRAKSGKKRRRRPDHGRRFSKSGIIQGSELSYF